PARPATVIVIAQAKTRTVTLQTRPRQARDQDSDVECYWTVTGDCGGIGTERLCVKDWGNKRGRRRPVREEEPKQRRADMANDAEELPQGPELHGIDGTPVETDPSLSLSHGVGSRVTCVDYFALPQTFQVGTVARHWVREDSWPDGLHFAYLVQLDNGRRVFARNDERFIRSSDAAPVYMPNVLAPRTIMKFKIDNVWRKGVLVALNEDWLDSGEAPHIVHFEEGGSTGLGSYRKIWGTDDTIVIDRVDFIENLKKTVAVASNREHVSVPTNLTTVKQSLRFDGHRIFAPEDTDHCVTKSSAPLPYSCYICCDSEFTKDNLIVRDCACRGDSSGWAHLECLRSWAKSNLASRQRKKPGFDVLELDGDSYNPFESCKMCRQFFDHRSLSKSVLIDAWRPTKGNKDQRENYSGNQKERQSAHLAQMLKDCACFYLLNGERNKCIQYYDEGVKIQTKIWGEVDQLPSIGTLEDLRNGVEVEVGFDADGVEWAFKRRFDP
ncbi:hypothetical protein THAOC_20843, partial [Thalassiosira oceanica]